MPLCTCQFGGLAHREKLVKVPKTSPGVIANAVLLLGKPRQSGRPYPPRRSPEGQPLLLGIWAKDAKNGRGPEVQVRDLAVAMSFLLGARTLPSTASGAMQVVPGGPAPS